MFCIAQRIAEQTGNPKILNVIVDKLHGVEFFCTCEPYLAGDEVFGFQKRKTDIPLSFEGKSHQLDKVNFSHPWIMTKSSRVNHANCTLPDVVEDLSPKLQEDHVPNNLGIMVDVGKPNYVTTIHAAAYKEI